MINFETLMNVMKEHNIPTDVKIITDTFHYESNVNCGVSFVYYNEDLNLISLRSAESAKDEWLRFHPDFNGDFDSLLFSFIDEYSHGNWKLIYRENVLSRVQDKTNTSVFTQMSREEKKKIARDMAYRHCCLFNEEADEYQDGLGGFHDMLTPLSSYDDDHIMKWETLYEYSMGDLDDRPLFEFKNGIKATAPESIPFEFYFFEVESEEVGKKILGQLECYYKYDYSRRPDKSDFEFCASAKGRFAFFAVSTYCKESERPKNVLG